MYSSNQLISHQKWVNHFQYLTRVFPYHCTTQQTKWDIIYCLISLLWIDSLTTFPYSQTYKLPWFFLYCFFRIARFPWRRFSLHLWVRWLFWFLRNRIKRKMRIESDLISAQIASLKFTSTHVLAHLAASNYK